MNIIYQANQERLVSVLGYCSHDSIYVIPDLQRPYVWSPKQVIMLIDSLFRGWPFGSLLAWRVPDLNENEGIPNRPFWGIVDRTGVNNGQAVSKRNPPAEYLMVLDGQQRLQSLLLALGDDMWGFKMMDSDWNAYIKGETRGKKGNHWSKASLCLDCQAFIEQYELHKEDGVSAIDISLILEWVVIDYRNDTSQEKRSANYLCPLPMRSDESNKDRFIRLSRIWNKAASGLTERKYQEIIDELLKENGFANASIERLKAPLAEFMGAIEKVKNNTFFNILTILPRNEVQCSEDEYLEAIVNIFTRLNSAGRPLSKEEITLSWFKTKWLPDYTDGQDAGTCIEKLRIDIQGVKSKVDTDDVVRLLTFVWSSMNNPDGTVLTSQDLLKSEKIRPVAVSLSQNWKKFYSSIEIVLDLINQRELENNIGSFNAVIVAVTVYYIFFNKYQSVTLNEVQRENALKQAAEIFGSFFDRWIFSSEWANTWADIKNFAKFSGMVNKYKTHVDRAQDSTQLLAEMNNFTRELLTEVQPQAINKIDSLEVDDRSRVFRYNSYLWIWHRLELNRWKESLITLRHKKIGAVKKEVDHTVSASYWATRIKDLSADTVTQIVKELAVNNIDTSTDTINEFLVSVVNSIGNCALLEKSFNISKNSRSMWSFISEMREFSEDAEKRNKWEEALDLSDSLTEPDAASVSGIVVAILGREQKIKTELRKFISGELSRKDIN